MRLADWLAVSHLHGNLPQRKENCWTAHNLGAVSCVKMDLFSMYYFFYIKMLFVMVF